MRAIAAYRSAIRLKPDLADDHANLGNALREKGLLKEAVDSLSQAALLRPDSAEIHINLGVALKRAQAHLESAIARFRRAAIAASSPEIAEAHNNLGNAALKELGKFDRRRLHRSEGPSRSGRIMPRRM